MPENWKHRHKLLKATNARKVYDDWSRADLIGHILELRAQLEKFEQKEAATAKENQSTRLESEFNQAWPYALKLLFVFELCGRPMTNFELTSILLKLDRNLKVQSNPSNYVAVVLNRLVKLNRVKKIKLPGIRITYYALPDWVVEEANLIAEYHKHITQSGV